MQAGILFISGDGRDVEEFSKQVEGLSRWPGFPLMVLFERKGFGDTEVVVTNLRGLADIPSVSISTLGHSTQFILNVLSQRLGAVV